MPDTRSGGSWSPSHHSPCAGGMESVSRELSTMKVAALAGVELQTGRYEDRQVRWSRLEPSKSSAKPTTLRRYGGAPRFGIGGLLALGLLSVAREHILSACP